ncbi:MAG TPA: hypothetical protein VFE89_08430 [Beijerinckiaceae bacterium]|nr:hypothetical protein [Beijerinckiaceae bacterium]
MIAGKVLLHLAVFVMEHRLAAEARAGITHLDVTAGELEEIRLMDGCGCAAVAAMLKLPAARVGSRACYNQHSHFFLMR